MIGFLWIEELKIVRQPRETSPNRKWIESCLMKDFESEFYLVGASVVLLCKALHQIFKFNPMHSAANLKWRREDCSKISSLMKYEKMKKSNGNWVKAPLRIPRIPKQLVAVSTTDRHSITVFTVSKVLEIRNVVHETKRNALSLQFFVWMRS